MQPKFTLRSKMKSSSDYLCCCEYVNEHGDRSHILTCCCDCQAFDEICERLITCRSIDTTLIERLNTTMWDRCRFPFPGGAKAINWTSISVLLVPPICLIFSTTHLLSNVISIFIFISFLWIFSQSRPQLHFSFVLSFIVTQVLIFAFESQPNLEIKFTEGIIVYSSLILSAVCLTVARYSKYPIGKQTPLCYLSWINSPVYRHNFGLLFIGSCILVGTAFYVTYLTVVTQCQISSFPLLLGCPEVYLNFRYASSFQCGVFSMTGGILLCLSVLKLILRWPKNKDSLTSVV